MASISKAVATIEDLALVEGKAELIGGRIVPLMPTGRLPNLVAGRIFRSLAGFVDDFGVGEVYTHDIGFTVPELTSGRQSFSPDVSYHVRPFSSNPMRFVDGAPTFAVEVRSEGDYGTRAEAEIAAKRADYSEAGTRIVWDVDPITEWIRVYRLETPDQFVEYQRGGELGGEPVVVGWRVTVDWIFG